MHDDQPGEYRGVFRRLSLKRRGIPPTFDYLLGQMKLGQDVELSLDWLGAAGNQTGGHAVVVSGVVQFGDLKGIWFNNGVGQGEGGGLRTNRFSPITDDGG